MKVAICVITFRRPEGLKRLLENLNRLEFKNIPPPDVQLVVVDNDPVGSAAAYCAQIKSGLRWPLTFAVEPRRGVAAARNRSLALVPADAEFVACIDDDEWPEPNWLEELLRAQQAHDADVVTGVVASEFESATPEWVKAGGFFQRRRFRTGERIKFGLTGNVLVRAALLRRMETIFNERFALTGGEDTHLFTRLYLAGHKMIASDEAVVWELVPATRTTVRWLVMRAYSGGSIRSRVERDLMPSLQMRCRRLVIGLVRMAQGVCLTVAGCVSGRAVLVRGLHWLFVGMGMVAGLFGARCEQYRQIHGK